MTGPSRRSVIVGAAALPLVLPIVVYPDRVPAVVAELGEEAVALWIRGGELGRRFILRFALMTDEQQLAVAEDIIRMRKEGAI